MFFLTNIVCLRMLAKLLGSFGGKVRWGEGVWGKRVGRILYASCMSPPANVWLNENWMRLRHVIIYTEGVYVSECVFEMYTNISLK